MSNSNAAIAVKDLVIKKKRRAILKGLTFSLPAGKITGLIGPSGSGKTTLMRTIVGAQAITKGSVEVLGEPAGSPGLRKRIGYVTQAPAIYPDLTVEQNLRYFATILKHGKDAAEKAMEDVDLLPQRKQLVATLSGGQRSRASLSVALLGNPEVLILDEPTIGLDPVLREQLWRLFKKLAADGKTLMVSSHVMDEAARCDDLLLLREGELIAATTPETLRKVTKTNDLDSAFLAVIDRFEKREASHES